MLLHKIFFAGLLYATIVFPNASMEISEKGDVKTNVKWAVEKSRH